MTQHPEPTMVVLAAVQIDVGIHTWTCPGDQIARHTTPQHVGYSESLPAFAVERPPPYLDAYQLLPAELFDPEKWATLPEAQTNTLKQRVRELLEDVGFL